MAICSGAVEVHSAVWASTFGSLDNSSRLVQSEEECDGMMIASRAKKSERYYGRIIDFHTLEAFHFSLGRMFWNFPLSMVKVKGQRSKVKD